MAGTMEQARLASNLSGNLVRIVYDFDKQQVFLLTPRVLGEGESPDDYDPEELLRSSSRFSVGDVGERDSSKVWLDSVQTYDGHVYNSGQFPVDIRPTGTPVGHVVHLVNSRDEEYSIELNPLAGTAHIYDYHKKVAEPKRVR